MESVDAAELLRLHTFSYLYAVKGERERKEWKRMVSWLVSSVKLASNMLIFME